MFDAEYEARLSPTKRSPLKQDKKTSPTKEIYSDRFIPSRTINLRESFSLLSSDPIINDASLMSEDVAPSPPKLSSSGSSIYQQVLQNELLSSRKVIIKDEPDLAASPPRDCTAHATTPVKRRLFTYRSEGDGKISVNGGNEHVINLRTSDSEALMTSLSPISAASQRLLSSPPKSSRKIAKTPFKVLQAPSIRDDFYLNVLDWGGNNQLAVALGRALFLWNATTCQVRKVTELDASDTIASVHWLDLKAHLIAIGTARGHVHIWDLVQERCVRTLTGPVASQRTSKRSVASSGPRCRINSRVAATTTNSPCGIRVGRARTRHCSSSRSTWLQSRPLPGLHISVVCWRVVVAPLTEPLSSGLH
jgi:cell division cycle 20-like protein 1 (cofactor of APC complex)